MKTRILLTLACVCLFVGCGTLYKTAVTITQVREDVMQELKALNKAGLISVETDAKITKADEAYRNAAQIAATALEEYKVSGDKTKYIAALRSTRAALNALIDILQPMIGSEKSSELYAALANANQIR